MKIRSLLVSLSIVSAGGSPPEEFLLFKKGQNPTSKGSFLFDEKAAALVMSDFRAKGVEMMIDWDHSSLNPAPLDPAQSGKSSGWFQLEVRNGDLWATSVRWTASAAKAITDREWRYFSPAFSVDKDNRITSLTNCALTNLPATRNQEPLIAAASKGTGMTLDQLMKVCKALGIDPTTGVDEALAQIRGTGPDPEDAPPPAGDGGADEPQEMAAPVPPPAAPPAPPAADKKKDVAASAFDMAANVARCLTLSGAASLSDAASTFAVWRASHLELESGRAKLAQERAVLESAEKRKLCAELVTLGAEFPATVWADDKATALKPRWIKMSVADLRDHVSEQRASRGGKTAPVAIRPPAQSSEGVPEGLTASELAICKLSGCDPSAYVQLKAFRDSGKGGV